MVHRPRLHVAAVVVVVAVMPVVSGVVGPDHHVGGLEVRAPVRRRDVRGWRWRRVCNRDGWRNWRWMLAPGRGTGAEQKSEAKRDQSAHGPLHRLVDRAYPNREVG